MVIIPDLRNHGRSPHSATLSYEMMAQDILDLMNRLEISQTAIVGHSMGAKVVLQLLQQAPQRFTSALLIDMSHQKYVSTDFAVFFQKADTIDSLIGIKDRAELTRQVKALFPEQWATLVLKNLYWDRKNHTFQWRCNFKQIKASLPQLSQAIHLPTSSPVEVSIICASESRIVTDQAIETLRNCFEKFVSYRVTSGHWVHLDQPQEVINVIDKMIESAPKVPI